MGALTGQSTFKSLPPADPSAASVKASDVRLNPAVLRSATPANWRHRGFRFDPDRLRPGVLPTEPGVVYHTDPTTGQVHYASGRPGQLSPSTASEKDALGYLQSIGKHLGLTNPTQEIKVGKLTVDTLGQAHLRISQQYEGLPVEPADAYLHASDASRGFDAFFGRLQPTPTGLPLRAGLSRQQVIDLTRASFGNDWHTLPAAQLAMLGEDRITAERVIYYHEKVAHLTYRLDLHPNLATHLTRYVDASSGQTIHEISHVCGTAGLHTALPPETANVRNLNGQNVTINTFSQEGQFFLFDVTRPMFRTDAGGDALGVIQTFNANGQSPLNDDFDPSTAASVNNTDWSRTAVSVHHNAGTAYQYFLDRFDRNSIDGLGGTIYSFYNVNNEDGTEMDNAFFSGRAMFYGNGDRAFTALPRSLDVAGHEMTHGVIQGSANLVYQLESGSINESMADVFGYLIEGETNDHRIGEDVVNTGVFRSGALRNMRDPNNGGTRFGDRGWQPAHMDEFVVLANNEENNYGGVHTNSGIPNRAFYLFSTTTGIGDVRAEQVYYRALTTYLTRNSRFIDLRIAVARSAADLYGAAAELAANEAFAAVGIGAPVGDTPEAGGNYENDLAINTGERFLLLTDNDQANLYLANEDGDLLNNPLATVGILSKPSITDDGTFAFFVDDQNRLRLYNFRTNQLLFLEQNPGRNWRNIAVSKDGFRIALTTTAQDNKVFIGDLTDGVLREMTLTNPTTSTDGTSTNNVLYADILEWEAGGEFLMYDALSELDAGIRFWDINFLRGWDMDNDRFGDGNIIKLYDQLEAGTSIGNPTFAKNSPYIIAFDRVNLPQSNFPYTTLAANIERGQTAAIFNGQRLGYPNYGVADDRLIFDAELDDGTAVLATIPMQEDKLTASGNPTVTIEGGHWGIFFATGIRDLTSSIEGPVVTDERVMVYPTLTYGPLTIERPEAATVVSQSIQVFDLSGRQLLALPLSGNTHTINLGQLPGGTYLLAIPTTGGTVIRKIIRQ